MVTTTFLFPSGEKLCIALPASRKTASGEEAVAKGPRDEDGRRAHVWRFGGRGQDMPAREGGAGGEGSPLRAPARQRPVARAEPPMEMARRTKGAVSSVDPTVRIDLMVNIATSSRHVDGDSCNNGDYNFKD
ncbi:hypothetical protein E2562_000464 [Oryza meyeriana var. granulata]|uniref:Uncharacterized protein n=1 Tax=Oryza meyeriana var. granulata TaxID=110450 RepID=A0A6G1CC63_9ORYZ|nr:hypothetical protein E2562_000464 [Oryza meyeriana var. granulata]